jgi:uncharacterized protein YciW
MSCHAEFLRVALADDDRLSRAVLQAPIEAIAEHCHDARQRALVELVHLVTATPWALDRAAHARWLAAGLTDDDILHAIALSSYFGHLNRIADAVAVALDYAVAIPGRPVERDAPMWPVAPALLEGPPAIALETRPATHAALASWRAYLSAKAGPLLPAARARIAHWVATWTGAASPDGEHACEHDAELRALAELVTLAPWRLDDRAFQPLRDCGFDDAALFDVCATASSVGTFSRIDVALIALAR